MGLTLEDMPFQRLIKEDSDLAETRQKYKSMLAKERQKAAEWAYDSELATEMFNMTLLRMPDHNGFTFPVGQGPCPGAVLALAIDPTFAPALLSIASVEYQLGRVDEAMKFFLTLATLPDDTEELAKIIDEAGDFLLDEEDYSNAKTLYDAAAKQYPNVSVYYTGLSYCFEKLGELDKAVDCAHKAVELEPDNCYLLSDLGWSLVEVKSYEEAKKVLEKAVELSPSDYEMAKNNLKELHRRMKLSCKRKKQR